MQSLAKTRLRPTEIAPETFLIHDHQGEGTAPVVVALNSLVIRARWTILPYREKMAPRRGPTARRAG